MNRRLGVLLLASASAAVGAAAWSSGIELGRSSDSVAATARPPGSLDDRTFLSKTQVQQALTAGEIDRTVRSVLKVDRRLHYGDFVWNEQGVPQGPVWVRVDLRAQLLSVFRAGHEIGTSVILYGADGKDTPAGVFPILAKAKDHRSSSYDADMPYTLRLTADGVSIHASEVQFGRATHGCIGVPLEFARKLFAEVATGDPVTIVSRPSLAGHAPSSQATRRS